MWKPSRNQLTGVHIIIYCIILLYEVEVATTWDRDARVYGSKRGPQTTADYDDDNNNNTRLAATLKTLFCRTRAHDFRRVETQKGWRRATLPDRCSFDATVVKGCVSRTHIMLPRPLSSQYQSHGSSSSS